MGSGRRLARLTLDNLDDLPSPCRGCVFWELDPVQRQRAEAAGDARCEKESWVSRVLLEWGSCGRILYVDETPAGYALYAPPRLVPGAVAFPTSPVSEDAVLLASVVVLPEFSGAGLGRVLVQSVVKDVLGRGGARAIEAYGDRRAGSRDVGADPALDEITDAGGERTCACVLPADFLLAVGFRTQRAHGRYPRLRLELRSVLSWRAEVEQALEKLLEAVRPRPRPVAPAAEREHG